MKAVFDEVLAPIIGREINQIEITDERYFGAFPAGAVIVNDGGPVEVLVETQTMEDLAKEYESDELPDSQLRQLYVQTGAVQAALRSHFDQLGSEQLQELHLALSSPDNLSRTILDETYFSDEEERLLLLSLRQGWIATDLAHINAGRLAIAIAYGNSILDTELLPDPTELHVAMTTHLKGTLDQKRVYSELFTSFGGTQEQAVAQFANTIPRIEVMGALALEVAEAEQLIKMIQAA